MLRLLQLLLPKKKLVGIVLRKQGVGENVKRKMRDVGAENEKRKIVEALPVLPAPLIGAEALLVEDLTLEASEAVISVVVADLVTGKPG